MKNNKDRRIRQHPGKISHNMASLLFVQIVNHVVPLVVVPYVTRVLGVKQYGNLAFYQAVLGYLLFVVDYSFYINATRQIARSCDDIDLRSQIFSQNWYLQIAIASIVEIVLLSTLVLGPTVNHLVIYAMIYVVFAHCLFPAWLLHGLEQMRTLAILEFAGKISMIPSIIFLVNSPRDAGFVIIAQGTAKLISALLFIRWLNSCGFCYISWPSIFSLLQYARNGLRLFAATFFSTLYTHMIPVILGIQSSSSQLAIFSLSSKIASLSLALTTPVSQAVFPRLNRLLVEDPRLGKYLFKKSSIILFSFSITLSLLMFIFSNQLVDFLGGEQFGGSVSILRCLAPLPMLVSISNLFGVQLLVTNNQQTSFLVVLSVGGVLALSFALLLTPAMGAMGAALSYLWAEVLVAVAMVLTVCRKRSNILHLSGQ